MPPPPSPFTLTALDILAAAEAPGPGRVWELRDLKRALAGPTKAAARKLAELHRKRRKEVWGGHTGRTLRPTPLDAGCAPPPRETSVPAC